MATATIINKMWRYLMNRNSRSCARCICYMFTHPGKKLNFMGNELAHWREWDEMKENDWFLLSYPAHDALPSLFRIAGRAVYERGRHCMRMITAGRAMSGSTRITRDKNMFSYLRKGKDKDYVVILNFSPNTYTHEVFGVVSKGHVPRDHQYGVGALRRHAC